MGRAMAVCATDGGMRPVDETLADRVAALAHLRWRDHLLGMRILGNVGVTIGAVESSVDRRCQLDVIVTLDAFLRLCHSGKKDDGNSEKKLGETHTAH